MAATVAPLRFTPSRVEGLPAVSEVVAYPDRLEMSSAGTPVVIQLADIAAWPKPRWFWRLVYRIGWRPRCLPVADRDWFHQPSDRFFRFFTDPPLVISMPVGDAYEREASHFGRIKVVLAAGGFSTFDLG